MLTSPFLTALDDRAYVKTSRDPLGLQSIWARFGRHVVGNLTTVTSSLRDFMVLLLGADLVERIVMEQGPEAELDAFLRWEQVAAYARVQVHDEEGVRGGRRVKRFLDEGRGRVEISAARERQILGNQAMYGIWGMYTATARASGLLDPHAFRLTPAGRELVEGEYHPRLAKRGAPIEALERIVARPSFALAVEGRHQDLVAAVADVLGPRVRVGERTVYRRHLLEGGPEDRTQGRQAALVRLLESVESTQPLSPALFVHLAKRASEAGDEGLAGKLARIRVCESLLAPMWQLFAFVLTADGQTVDEVGEHIGRAWGAVETIDLEAVRAIEGELGQSGPGVGERLFGIAEALVRGDHARAVEGLVAQNTWVMSNRGGAAWVAIEDGRLRVRVEEETAADLSPRDDLASLWRFPYFIDSLRALMRAIGPAEEDR